MNDISNLSYWNRFSGLYDKIMHKDKTAYDELYTLIGSRLHNKMSVLELATGTGLIALNIAQKVRVVEATDFSDGMIKQAKKKSKPNNLHFSVQDACNLPYDDKTFDAVIISNALHIMPNPEIALKNIYHVLTDDGILFAPCFTHRGSIKAMIISKMMVLTGFVAYKWWTPDEYCNYLRSNGFKIEKRKVLKASFPICYVEASKTAVPRC